MALADSATQVDLLMVLVVRAATEVSELRKRHLAKTELPASEVDPHPLKTRRAVVGAEARAAMAAFFRSQQQETGCKR